MSDRRVDGIVERLAGQHARAEARDVVQYMQCFDASGKPLFTREQVATILEAIGRQAVSAAERGDDRTLKRMIDAQLKLAAVNAKLAELDTEATELEQLVTRLRDRQRAASTN